MLAKTDNMQEAYRTVFSALSANVFYHCPESMFLIHVSWFSKCQLKAVKEIKLIWYSMCSDPE